MEEFLGYASRWPALTSNASVSIAALCVVGVDELHGAADASHATGAAGHAVGFR
jgi:hypothetical protein